MALNLPPHLAEDYQRIMGGRFDQNGELSVRWPAATPEEAKDSIERAKLAKKELRLLKTTTRQEQKLVRQEHVANRQNVQAGFVMTMFGKKAAASDRIAKREGSKAEQAVALQPYDNLVHLIDRSILDLDRLVLDLKPKAAVKPSKAAKNPKPGAPVEPATEVTPGAHAAPSRFQTPPVTPAPQPTPPVTPPTPVRQRFVVHADAIAEGAVLAEWWRPPDGDIESRSLRFLGPGGIWLDGDDLPPSLQDVGCSIAKVAGVTHHPGIASREINVGWTLALRPEPSNPYDPNAIGVWTPDGDQQVGYLPREVAAATMAESRRRQRAFGALVVTEYRGAGSGERVGAKVMIGPARIWAEPEST